MPKQTVPKQTVPKQNVTKQNVTKQNVTKQMWLAEVALFAKMSRHGAAQSRHKAKIEVAPGAKKKTLRAFFGPGGATSIFALSPDCAAP